MYVFTEVADLEHFEHFKYDHNKFKTSYLPMRIQTNKQKNLAYLFITIFCLGFKKKILKNI